MDIKIPQSSGHTEHLVDKAVYKERDDSLVRAATTASSLNAVSWTFENVSNLSYDPLLTRGNTLRSGEDSLKLKELMELCTNLQNRVLDLEKTKTTKDNEIVKLKMRVKKVKQKKRTALTLSEYTSVAINKGAWSSRSRLRIYEVNDNIKLPFDQKMLALEDDSIFRYNNLIFDFLNDDEDDGAIADMNNLDTTIQVSSIPTIRIHKDHPLDQVIRYMQSATQTRNMSKNLEEYGCVSTTLKQRRNHKNL
ncbi:hypothetical protein Tco_1153436 [Tanacetum coccineum]